MNSNFLLLEDNRRRDIIRRIVRDIVKVYKSEDEGEFYLPNYIDEDLDSYHFPGVDGLEVVLDLTPNTHISTFKIDGNLYNNNNLIEIIVEYNPNNRDTIIYDLIGELNEIVAHELRHVDQKTKGTHDLSNPETSDPFRYYTQPHEIDAQVFGFKRLAKLTKTPFDIVVKRWFNTHKDLHQLTTREMYNVINRILNKK